MTKSTIAAFVVAVLAMCFSFGAQAAPLTAFSSQLAAETGIVPVADGCGRGFYYSNRRGGCVEDDRDFDRGPPRGYDRPQRGYDRPQRGYGYVDSRMSKDMCQSRCLQTREVCNRVKGGYFNGCGIEGAACIARCD